MRMKGNGSGQADLSHCLGFNNCKSPISLREECVCVPDSPRPGGADHLEVRGRLARERENGQTAPNKKHEWQLPQLSFRNFIKEFQESYKVWIQNDIVKSNWKFNSAYNWKAKMMIKSWWWKRAKNTENNNTRSLYIKRNKNEIPGKRCWKLWGYLIRCRLLYKCSSQANLPFYLGTRLFMIDDCKRKWKNLRNTYRSETNETISTL